MKEPDPKNPTCSAKSALLRSKDCDAEIGISRLSCSMLFAAPWWSFLPSSTAASSQLFAGEAFGFLPGDIAAVLDDRRAFKEQLLAIYRRRRPITSRFVLHPLTFLLRLPL